MYLLAAGVYEVDFVVQTAVHLPDELSGGLHTDHNPLLCDVQGQYRSADFGCRHKDFV